MPAETQRVYWPRRLLAVGGIALIFISVCICRYYLRGINDDAMITYRYARNLVEGHGLVYNPGEYVLGTTTPLYTLLVAGSMAAGSTPWMFSLVLDCFLVTALIALVIRWVSLAGDRWLAWVGAFALFHSPHSLLPNAGMETGVFMLFTYGALFLVMNKRFRWAFAVALAATLTRPEGVLVLGIAGVCSLYDFERKTTRRLGWIPVAIAGAVLGVFALWLMSYYGQILPQSVIAKQAQAAGGGSRALFVSRFFAEQFHPYGRFTILGFFEWAGLVLMWWRLPKLRLLIVWSGLYLLFMWIGKAPFYVWYLTPLYPIRCFAAVYALLTTGRAVVKVVTLSANSPEEFPAQLQFSSAVVGFFLFFFLSGSYLVSSNRVFRWAVDNNFPVLYCKKYEEAGRYIAMRSNPNDEVVSEEIGYIGYLSDCRLFDPVGLVSPEAVKEIGRMTPADWAVKRKSRFLVTTAFQGGDFQPMPDEFVEAYRPQRVWRDAVFQTAVFERQDSDISKLAALAEQPAGYHPGIEEPVYAIRGSATKSGGVEWSIEGPISLRSIEWYVYPKSVDRGKFEVSVNGQQISIADAGDYLSIEIQEGTTLDKISIKLSDRNPDSYLVLRDVEIAD